MADYEKAFRLTILGNEGGYNPGVNEKETYAGIDRGANPHWSGWKIIDNIKANYKNITPAKMNILLATNKELQANIRDFFKANYWDTAKLDHVNDQQIASNLFDCSVNQGEGLARKFMQGACNACGATLTLDGQIGPATLDAINTLPADKLMAAINAERLASYKKDRQYPMWGKVWEKRLVNYV